MTGTIAVQDDVHDRLFEIKERQDSYSDVVERLLDNYEEEE